MNIKKVLLTGGRAPGTLELARLFSKAGAEVHLAESFAHAVTRRSRHVHAFHLVAGPKQAPALFIRQLIDIIEQEHITLLVPTCEEIFYIARHKSAFPSGCTVFTDDFSKLEKLHNKYEFIESAGQFGLPVPETKLARNKEAWEKVMAAISRKEDVLAKPVFTRFSTALLFPEKDHSCPFDGNTAQQWVIQQRLDGRQICTYSIAVNGQIKAHTAYYTLFRAGHGAAIAFEHANHPLVFLWVEEFVRKMQFTGQIAFDFIEGADGAAIPIECNPRMTSGIHLFGEAEFSKMLNGGTGGVISPISGSTRKVGLAFLLYAASNIKANTFNRWLVLLHSARDVIFDWNDLAPAAYQFESVFRLWRLSRRLNLTMLEASVWDIAWDGEEN